MTIVLGEKNILGIFLEVGIMSLVIGTYIHNSKSGSENCKRGVIQITYLE